MGSFYGNITLKGPMQHQVAAYLREHGRDAYVSPTIHDITVVYDREEYDLSLAADLSGAFRCSALWAAVADSDVFFYVLYESGAQIDGYGSRPDLQEDPSTSSGAGNAQVLCAAFGAERAVEQVDLLLHHDAFVMEEHRHWAVAEALSLPAWAHGDCYQVIIHNDEIGGGDKSMLVATQG